MSLDWIKPREKKTRNKNGWIRSNIIVILAFGCLCNVPTHFIFGWVFFFFSLTINTRTHSITHTDYLFDHFLFIIFVYLAWLPWKKNKINCLCFLFNPNGFYELLFLHLSTILTNNKDKRTEQKLIDEILCALLFYPCAVDDKQCNLDSLDNFCWVKHFDLW